MNRLRLNRRISTGLAAAALLSIPFGCGSNPPAAEVPAPPAVVADTQPSGFTPSPMPGTPPEISSEPPGTLDPSVRQATSDLKRDAKQEAIDARKEVRDAEAEARKAVEDAETEAKRKAKQVERDARKSAEEAIEKLLPDPK